MATVKERATYSEFVIKTNTGTFSYPVINYGLVTLQLVLSGVTTGAFKFQASCDSTDGTNGNWVDLYGSRSDSATVEKATGNLSTSPAYSWDLSVANYSFIKITATGGTFGTATFVCVKFEDASETMPTVQIAGTSTVSISGTPAVTATPATPTTYSLNSAATTNAVSVKAAAGTLLLASISNQNAAVRVLKVYNMASAPTVGTDIPVLSFIMPASSTQVFGFGALGQRFSTGIAIATTTGVADSVTTAVAVGDLKINLSYL